MRRLAMVRNTFEKEKTYTTINIDLIISRFRALEAKINKEGFNYFLKNTEANITDTEANVIDTEAKVIKEDEDEDKKIADAFQQVTAEAEAKAKGKGKVKKIGWEPIEEQDAEQAVANY
jgi:hypothetical protein